MICSTKTAEPPEFSGGSAVFMFSVEMPMAHRPWGDYMGSFQDKFGVMWMINLF